MAFIGGDVVSVSYKHPTLGNGTWYPKSNEDATIDKGGYQATDDQNMITSAGDSITQINRKRWEVEVTCAWDTQNTDEVGQANLLAGNPIDADWTFEHINGTIWGAKGRPVGEVKGSSDKATFKVKLSGGGNLLQL